MSERAQLDLFPGVRTVQVPGGSQALARSEYVDVDVGGRRGRIRRPNLLGAILVKARAIEIDDVPDAQRADLGRLLTLIEDPIGLRADLTTTERRWLATHAELQAPDHPAWDGIDNAGDGQTALAILMNP